MKNKYNILAYQILSEKLVNRQSLPVTIILESTKNIGDVSLSLMISDSKKIFSINSDENGLALITHEMMYYNESSILALDNVVDSVWEFFNEWNRISSSNEMFEVYCKHYGI